MANFRDIETEIYETINSDAGVNGDEVLSAPKRYSGCLFAQQTDDWLRTDADDFKVGGRSPTETHKASSTFMVAAASEPNPEKRPLFVLLHLCTFKTPSFYKL